MICTEVIMSDSTQLFYQWEIPNTCIIFMFSVLKRLKVIEMLRHIFTLLGDINSRVYRIQMISCQAI